MFNSDIDQYKMKNARFMANFSSGQNDGNVTHCKNNKIELPENTARYNRWQIFHLSANG